MDDTNDPVLIEETILIKILNKFKEESANEY